MISNEDIYADKDGKITNDPSQYARQIAVKGFELDERIAKRFGITDTLVSVNEPNAVRRVTGRNEASVKIVETEDKSEEKPQEPVVADEPESKVKVKPAKKGEKK